MTDKYKRAKELLECRGLFIPQLKVNACYSRQHDDTDGGGEGWVSVAMTTDGDMWVNTDAPMMIRFCTWEGGGHSLRVHNALRMLALAIILDNAEHPQNRPQTEPGAKIPEVEA